MNEWYTRARDFLLGDPLPKEDPGTATEWVQLANWTDGEQLLVLSLGLIVLLITVWNLRRARTWPQRIGLFLLRAAIPALLLFTFYQPALLEEKQARSTNTIVLLTDDSASMALPHAGQTRRDLAATFVRDHSELWRGIEVTNALESFRFSNKVEEADWRDIDKALAATGERTEILETFEDLRDRYRNRDIGGIILISDGIDNGRAGRILSGGNALDQETLRLLRSFEAPIHTVGLLEDSIKDVGVAELRYSPFAFKRNQSTIEADISVQGYEEGTLEVELLEEGHLVRSVTRKLEPGVRTYTASFDFTPTELGHRVYAVRVNAFSDEVTLENNERYAVIRVNRDKIRVLQIGGHPSWDVRFLRNHLKRTPNIQLISFFILIRMGALRSVRPGETALIPFPAQELFVQELGGFDLVILQDFNYGPFSTPEHLHRIRDYVKDGGALAMVGGRLSMGAGDYVGTELDEILPVEMREPTHDDDALDTREFQAELTQEGETHPVTRLAFDPIDNRRIWATLPPLEGVNEFNGLAHGGIALVRHPDRKGTDGRGQPVIAINEPGTGRAAVVATDSLWRLKMPIVGDGGDGRHYDQIWGNLIRWLIKDPELDLVRVEPSEGVRALGEAVDLEIRVFEPDYRPAVEKRVQLKVTRRPTVGEQGSGQLVHEALDIKTGDHGRHTETVKPERPGIYDVEAMATIGGRQLSGKTVFVVSDERPEMKEVVSQGQLLAAISEATGGLALSLDARNVALRFNPPRVSDVTSRTYHERWNVPAVFLLAVLLFTIEWWVRRKVGFL